jgi:hypothetical protein
MLAVGAANTVNRAEGAYAVRHRERAQAVQPRIAVRRIRRVEFTARADQFQRASVLKLLQQLEIVVAGNAEHVSDACLLETTKQEIADLHSLALVARLRFCLLRLVSVRPVVQGPEAAAN